MKTSVIEVPDLLSVLTVDEVEQRFVEVPGVESATVNYAAGKITVRYDETLLTVADIRVFVHQRGQQPADETQPEDETGNTSGHKPAEPAAPDSASPPEPALPKASAASSAMPAATSPAAEGQTDKPTPDAPPSPGAS